MFTTGTSVFMIFSVSTKNNKIFIYPWENNAELFINALKHALLHLPCEVPVSWNIYFLVFHALPSRLVTWDLTSTRKIIDLFDFVFITFLIYKKDYSHRKLCKSHEVSWSVQRTCKHTARFQETNKHTYFQEEKIKSKLMVQKYWGR